MLHSSIGWNKELPGNARTKPVIVVAGAVRLARGGTAFVLVIQVEQKSCIIATFQRGWKVTLSGVGCHKEN